MKRMRSRFDDWEDKLFAKFSYVNIPIPKRLINGIVMPYTNAGWMSTSQYRRDYERMYGDSHS